MKMTERYLWIAGLILAGFVIQNHANNNANLQTLLATYAAESDIKNSQISDFNTQLSVVRAESHSQGFEEGKTQAGIALARGGSLYEYADGYHAAIGQRVEEEDLLQISEAMVTELNSLRKMVPRLLSQNQELQTKVQASVNSAYVADILLDNLDASLETELTYLELLEMLTAPSELPASPNVLPRPSLPETPIAKQKE